MSRISGLEIIPSPAVTCSKLYNRDGYVHSVSSFHVKLDILYKGSCIEL